MSKEILPTLSVLIMDPFGSHVVRSILTLLDPSLVAHGSTHSVLVRSKRSATWKAKQGPMKSVLNKEQDREFSSSLYPPAAFNEMAAQFLNVLRNELGENEIRAMAANKVASPGLQVREAL